MDSRLIDLRALHAALGGDIVGNQALCAGPGHSKRDRSLAVKPATNGGFVVHSFAGDDWRECRDYVRERLGLAQWNEEKPSLRLTHPQSDSKQTVERAKRIWDEGRDPRVPAVGDYLASRKLDLPAELCGSVLRFHPRCPWRTDDRVEFIPCLIAAFVAIKDNEVSAIHRIRLDQPQRWPRTDRKMLGDIRGSTIKLDPLGQRLAIAEGLESALAARQLGFGPVWALGSARTFPPVDGINELIILGERDEASRKAANASFRLWTEHGNDVFLALPKAGNDFNDVLMVRD
jgi:hypothetical protein